MTYSVHGVRMCHQFYILVVGVLCFVLTALGENYTVNYTLWGNNLSWNKSREECETHGGYLVTVNSQQVLDLLTKQFDTRMSEELWIGMKVTKTNYKCKPYTWHSGKTEGQWKNWASSEPNDCDKHTCVRIDQRKWKTMDCVEEYKFICENEHTLGENYTVNYTLWDKKLSWNKSREVCESYGGYLVTVNSQQVLDLLITQFDTRMSEELWIGMKVTKISYKCKPYTWHSGETAGNWKNWGNNEPNHCDTETCVRIKEWKWKTKNCDDKYKFICEFQHKPTRNGQTQITSLLETDSSGGLDGTPYQSTVYQVSSSSSYFTESIRNGPRETSSFLATDSSVRLGVTHYQSTVHHVTSSSSYVTDPTKTGQTETTSMLPTDSDEGIDVTPNQSTDYPVRSSRGCCTGEEKEMKCGHIYWDENNTPPNEALEEQIKILKQELRVIRNSTKIYLRSKISVHDNRSSSTAIGIVGVLVVIAVVAFPVAIDLVKLIAFIKQRQHSPRDADTDNI